MALFHCIYGAPWLFHLICGLPLHLWSIVAMFHCLYSTPWLCFTVSMVHHGYVSLSVWYTIAMFHCLYGTLAMFHCLYDTPWLCFTVSMVHRDYVSLSLWYTMAMFHSLYGIPMAMFHCLYGTLWLCFTVCMVHRGYVSLFLWYTMAMFHCGDGLPRLSRRVGGIPWLRFTASVLCFVMLVVYIAMFHRVSVINHGCFTVSIEMMCSIMSRFPRAGHNGASIEQSHTTQIIGKIKQF